MPRRKKNSDTLSVVAITLSATVVGLAAAGGIAWAVYRSRKKREDDAPVGEGVTSPPGPTVPPGTPPGGGTFVPPMSPPGPMTPPGPVVPPLPPPVTPEDAPPGSSSPVEPGLPDPAVPTPPGPFTTGTTTIKLG